jgi:hypothetical protein
LSDIYNASGSCQPKFVATKLLTMKAFILTVFVLILSWTNAQTTNKMKLNAGIITGKLQETKNSTKKFWTLE